eukprot:g3595.t1
MDSISIDPTSAFSRYLEKRKRQKKNRIEAEENLRSVAEDLLSLETAASHAKVEYNAFLDTGPHDTEEWQNRRDLLALESRKADAAVANGVQMFKDFATAVKNAVEEEQAPSLDRDTFRDIVKEKFPFWLAFYERCCYGKMTAMPDYNWPATVLCLASKRGHIEVVQLILEGSARGVAGAIGFRGMTPVMLAAKYGKIKIFRLLLSHAPPPTMKLIADDDDDDDEEEEEEEEEVKEEDGEKEIIAIVHSRKQKGENVEDSEMAAFLAKFSTSAVDETKIVKVKEKSDTDEEEEYESYEEESDDYEEESVDVEESNAQEHLLELLNFDSSSNESSDDEDEFAVDINFNGIGNQIGRKTALMLAAESGSSEIVHELLLRHSVDINAQSSDGRTALALAAGQNHMEVISLLLQRRIDMESNELEDDYSEDTLYSDSDTDSESFSTLDADLRDVCGRTALHWACRCGSREAAALLISSSTIFVDVNATDAMGYTPLIYASRAGDPEIVAMLLEDDDGYNSVNMVERGGWTALMMACDKGNLSVIRNIFMIASKVVDVNIAALGSGYTALHLAARHGHVEVVELLLTAAARSINVNHISKSGDSALSIISRFGSSSLLIHDDGDEEMRESMDDDEALEFEKLRRSMQNKSKMCRDIMKAILACPTLSLDTLKRKNNYNWSSFDTKDKIALQMLELKEKELVSKSPEREREVDNSNLQFSQTRRNPRRNILATSWPMRQEEITSTPTTKNDQDAPKISVGQRARAAAAAAAERKIKNGPRPPRKKKRNKKVRSLGKNIKLPPK